jgi:hypothetical protein
MSEPTAPIEFRYRVTRADYITLCRVMTRRSPWRGLHLAMIYVGVVLVSLLVNARGDLPRAVATVGSIAGGHEPSGLYIMIAIGIGVPFLTPLIVRLQGGAVYRRNSVAEKDIRVIIDDGGAETLVTGMQSKFDWSALRRLIETRDHFFLTISEREALMLPKRGLATPADAERLRTLAAARLPTG